MMVHRHPVFQKVIIGVFVWGMLIFGIHVANGQMQFPTGDMMGPPPGGMPNFTFPTDMPRPPDMPQPPAGVPPMPNIPPMPSQPPMPSIPPVPADMPDPSKLNEMMQKGEEMRRAGEEQGLAQMKKGAKSMDRVIKTVQGKVDALKAKGGVVSEVLLKGLADYAPASAAMQAATSIADAQAQFEIMQEVMDMLQEELPKLEMSANLPKIFKQVEKEYTKLVNAVKKQRSKLAAVKEQLAEKIAELDANVAAIRAAIDEAKAPGVAPDVAIETLQDKAFDKFEETWQIYASLEALRAMKATMTKVATQIKANDRLIAKIKKVNVEIAAELSALQAEIRQNYEELKAMPNTTDPDLMFEKLSVLADLQQSFEDTVIGSQDDGDVTNNQLNAGNNWGVPQFAPPSGFPGSTITDVNSLKNMQNIAPFMPKK